MIGGGGEVRHSRATSESLDLLYTLDPHDIDESTNDADRERMKKYIEGVLDEFLSDRQRQIVKMYYGQKLSSYKIATNLKISPKTVQRILVDAWKKIQQHKNIFLKSLIKS
jgi:RNA polymerase sigma factor (sigma-70 family)